MAGFEGLDVGQERQASQRQVANEVQSLMPAKFIWKTQGPVHDAIVGEHDSVFKRAAANEAHGLERLNVTFEAKRPGASKQVAEGLRSDHHFYFLLADQRVREIHVAAHTKFIGGVDAAAAGAFAHVPKLPKPSVAAPSPDRF